MGPMMKTANHRKLIWPLVQIIALLHFRPTNSARIEKIVRPASIAAWKAGADLAPGFFTERSQDAASEHQQRLQCDFGDNKKRDTTTRNLFGSDLKVIKGSSKRTFFRRLFDRARAGEVLQELFGAHRGDSVE